MRPLSFALAGLFLLSGCASQCFVKQDETVDFFPTYAYRQPDGKLAMPVTAWVHEAEPKAELQKDIARLVRLVSLIPGAGAMALEEKVMPFLVKGRSGRKVPIESGDKTVKAGKSDEDGYVQGDVVLEQQAEPGWLTFRTPACKEDKRRFEGKALVIPASGYSLVTVLEAVMPPDSEDATFTGLYRDQESRGAVLHYLSNQPWQLYTSLSRTLEQRGFPPGVLHLKTLPLNSMGDSAEAIITKVAALVSSPAAYSRPTIEALLKRFPERRFILVGNSMDAEAFQAIARASSKQVTKVLIRGKDFSTADELRAQLP